MIKKPQTLSDRLMDHNGQLIGDLFINVMINRLLK